MLIWMNNLEFCPYAVQSITYMYTTYTLCLKTFFWLIFLDLEKTKSSLWLIQRSFCLTKDLCIHIISGSPSDECSKGLWDL